MGKERMPKQLFVQFEKDCEPPQYWIGREKLEIFEEEGKIGIYRLVEVKTMKIKKVLE